MDRLCFCIALCGGKTAAVTSNFSSFPRVVRPRSNLGDELLCFRPASPTRAGDLLTFTLISSQEGSWVSLVAIAPCPSSPAMGTPHGLVLWAWESLPIQEQPGTADPGRLRAFKEVWG